MLGLIYEIVKSIKPTAIFLKIRQKKKENQSIFNFNRQKPKNRHIDSRGSWNGRNLKNFMGYGRKMDGQEIVHLSEENSCRGDLPFRDYFRAFR